MRPPVLFSLLMAAACTAANGGGASSSGSSSSGASTGVSSTGGSSTGGASTAAACPAYHCAAGISWTVDCDGGTDGGPCAYGFGCNAAGTACIPGNPTACASNADCSCDETCLPNGCVVGQANPITPCTSDRDCGRSCAGLTCVDGGCEQLVCGPVTCAPGCWCDSFAACRCPAPSDAGPACVTYSSAQCSWNPCTLAFPDGGCDCAPGVMDPQGRCVACVQDSDCDAGLHCDLDLNSFSNFETCVPCTAPDQCGAGRVCDTSQNQCVADCRLPSAACDAGCALTGVCGECAVDADCAAGSACALWPDGGWIYGVPPACRLRCHADGDCSAPHPLCDTALGYCVDCLQDADCWGCSLGGVCMSDSCIIGIQCL